MRGPDYNAQKSYSPCPNPEGIRYAHSECSGFVRIVELCGGHEEALESMRHQEPCLQAKQASREQEAR